MRRWLSYSLVKELQMLNTVKPLIYDHQMPCPQVHGLPSDPIHKKSIE